MNAIELEKKLTEHNVTLAGSPRKVTSTKQAPAQAAAQAKRLGFKGAVAQVFEKEAQQGYVNESQFENVTEQSLLLKMNPLAWLLGVAHPGSTTHTENPATGEQSTEPHAGGGEEVQKSANSALEALSSFISGYGIRALEVIGGALLILFGLFTIAKGEIPHASVSV